MSDVSSQAVGQVVGQTVELPIHFTQPQLGGLKDIVNHHRENGHVVQFDARDVERVDGAAVQFMVAVSKLQSEANNQPLLFNPNDVVLKALDDMGVHEHVSIDAGDTESVTAEHGA